MLSRHIAEKLQNYETPFYLYDIDLLRRTLESVVYESAKHNYKVHYAIKANYDDHLLEIIREYGLGIDCASGNEVRKALEMGFDPKGIVYAGVGKRDKELRYAIEQNILTINCESLEELFLVDELSKEAGCKTDVALRINPDIDPKTNHCIDTGQADSKFGISYEEVLERVADIQALENINIIGLHLHIGSQIRELHVFENMCEKVNVIVENLDSLGFNLSFIDVGGGLGINYDVPEENEYYIHRIGRTGRARRKGISFTLIGSFPEKAKLDEIAKFSEFNIIPMMFDEYGCLLPAPQEEKPQPRKKF